MLSKYKLIVILIFAFSTSVFVSVYSMSFDYGKDPAYFEDVLLRQDSHIMKIILKTHPEHIYSKFDDYSFDNGCWNKCYPLEIAMQKNAYRIAIQFVEIMKKDERDRELIETVSQHISYTRSSQYYQNDFNKVLKLMCEVGFDSNATHRNGIYLLESCYSNKHSNFEAAEILVSFGASIMNGSDVFSGNQVFIDKIYTIDQSHAIKLVKIALEYAAEHRDYNELRKILSHYSEPIQKAFEFVQ